MAGAALLGRLAWYIATVVEGHGETATARTLVLDVPGWPGHDAGQHVDVRLARRRRLRSGALVLDRGRGAGRRVELTVEELADGEVSPYLVRSVAPGDRLEIRGPVGGWFMWRPA